MSRDFDRVLDLPGCSRRRACGLLALLGGAAVLSGCASSGGGRSTTAQTTDEDWRRGTSGGGGSATGRTPGQEALERFRREHGGAATGVVPRREWTRTGPVMSRAEPLTRVTRITVHHDGMSPFVATSQASAMARIENIRRAHVNQGWADIGYHYIVDPGGRVYEGRPIRMQGAHVKYNNEENLGILVLGNYNEQSPTIEARQAVDAFVAEQMRRYRVPVGRVYTHQEIRPTQCPGRSLQAHMNNARAGRGALRTV